MASPELLAHLSPEGPRCHMDDSANDMWALACSFHRMLTCLNDGSIWRYIFDISDEKEIEIDREPHDNKFAKANEVLREEQKTLVSSYVGFLHLKQAAPLHAGC